MAISKDLYEGNATNVTGTVTKIIEDQTDTREDRIEQDREMRKAEMEYELEKSKLSIEQQALYLQDAASARNRETAIQSSATATKLGKNISSYLAIAATALCFGLFYIVLFNDTFLRDVNGQLNQGKKDILIYILGVLSALLTQVYSYYFGSSSGSADKSRTLSDVLAKKENA